MNTQYLEGKKIIIVGGGPGGLSLARVLEIKGVDVMVYERDRSRKSRVQGSSLDLHADSGQLLIKAAELTEQFQKLSRPEGEQHRVYDKHGNLILDIPAYKISASRPEIDRGVLRDMLLDSLKPGTVRWDKQFLSLTELTEGSIELLFADGDRVRADIVIGSDGASSRIRPYITDIRPHYSGTTLIQGEVEDPAEKCPRIYEMLHKGNMFVLGDSRAIMLQQKGDGTIIFYVTVKHPEDWVERSGIDFKDNLQVVRFLDGFFLGWDPVFRELFTASTEFNARKMYGTPADQHWTTKPNRTLIGDAAHVMPPFAGVGVNMAMLDALELANALTNERFNTLEDALIAYEKHMLARTAAAQERTKNSEDIFHSPTAIADLLAKLKKEARDHESPR